MTAQGTIRNATPLDLPEIQRLQKEAELRGLLVRELGEHHFIALDAPDGRGLAAIALIRVEGERGHVGMVVVDVRYEHTGLEERMFGVAEALCSALGAKHVDIAPARAA